RVSKLRRSAVEAGQPGSAPGSRIVDYYNRMGSAHSSLGDSINSFAKALNLANGSGDIDAALSAVEKGLVDANAAPGLDDKAEAFRQRLIGLLNQQKAAVDRYRQQGGSVNPEARVDARTIRGSYERFRAEYDPWLESYLEENGYELKKE
ncbi:MAG TPA: hypothetical protein VLU47_06145, partial [Blastocatellia bacterium]|nr:hypothetical protein [Blastocatellia bacterium]